MSSKLKVNLLRYTPEPEKLIASAAKLCYSSVGVSEIEEKLNEENITKFLDMLMGMGHESPVEHVSFTFGVEEVSRVLTHQLVRHRVGCSYSQQSQRYVK
ncbi:MAG: thymidylate synthase, partial [Candidatus Petromonas sp.]|nr:thymidylate synthase [Candidatus Petromonas sp.]